MSFFQGRRVVVTGANRGIGLALTEALLTQGAHVYAGVRQPDTATALHALGEQHVGMLDVIALDVQTQASVSAFAKHIGAKAIDVLINNAGVNLDQGRKIAQLPADVIASTFDANTLGPYRMLQTLLPALHQAPKPIVANISSIMGSIADNESGGNVAYRMSKTAVNMLTKCLALENDKLIALTLHPGWVRTRMGGDKAQIDVQTSARGLLDVIGRAGPKDSGKYFRYSGEQAAW